MLEPGTARQVKDQTLAMKLSDLKSRIASTLSAAGQGAGNETSSAASIPFRWPSRRRWPWESPRKPTITTSTTSRVNAPYTPVQQAYDLNALSNKTVTFLVVRYRPGLLRRQRYFRLGPQPDQAGRRFMERGP